MKSQLQNFYRTLLFINSMLILVFILFFIERLDLSYLARFSFILVFLVAGILKIYFTSGISGCILEVISGEELVLQFRRFHQNVKDFWQYILIVLVIQRLVDFSLFSFLPSSRVWRDWYFRLLGVLAVYVLARWIINKKYISPLGLPRRSSRFNLMFLLVMILAYFLELALVRFSGLIQIKGFEWQNILSFMLTYLHVFEFIFCSLYIFDAYPEVYEKFNRPKEIFLINPMGTGVVKSLASWFLRDSPPVFVVLKALSPKTYQFREFNRCIWRERYYKSHVLVCITCLTSNCYEAYKLAKEFKKRGSTVIMGGPHVTYLSDEALAFCDSVIIGQAEGVWKEVIRDYENGTLKLRYSGPSSEADYAQVYEELLNSPPHIIKDFLETMRGCKFRCHFCTIPSLSNGQTHLHPTGNIVELLKKIKPWYPKVSFIDNNVYSDPGYAKELFTALKPLKIKWYGLCTIDIAKNQETLKLAKESGCVGLLFGYEVSGGSLEKNQGGKFAMAHKYIEYTHIIKKAGIAIKGHFIFGFDSDNWKTLFQLWKFCFSIMPRFTVLSMLTPLPGSGLYRDMMAQNRVINLNWRSYDVNKLVVSHPQMDNKIVSFFFPLIQPLFLITTSSFGILILIILCVAVCISR